MSENIKSAMMSEDELESVSGGVTVYGQTATVTVASGYLAVRSSARAGSDNQIGGLLNGAQVTLAGPFTPNGYTLVTAYCGKTPWTNETGWQTGYVNSNYIRLN